MKVRKVLASPKKRPLVAMLDFGEIWLSSFFNLQLSCLANTGEPERDSKVRTQSKVNKKTACLEEKEWEVSGYL